MTTVDQHSATTTSGTPLLLRLNTSWHERALWVYGAVVLAHWLEHLMQALQIWVLNWPRPEARGILGLPFPWLVKSEALHFGFAVFMLGGLILLRPGFFGRSRFWWTLTLAIQTWHLVEHALLQGQQITGVYLFGGAVPTSVAQNWVPRVELHLFYNFIVTVPMIVAMVLHSRPQPGEPVVCSCQLRQAVAV